MIERPKFLIFCRVSTSKQGDSGLSLSAQQIGCENYVLSVNGEIIETIIEIESAGNKDRISISNQFSLETLLRKRPKLLYCIQKAQKENACIAVLEASRLSRFSLLIDFLLSTNVKFVSAQSPQDTPLLIRIKTSLNEEFLTTLSLKTKLALQQKKIELQKQGLKLGTPANLTRGAILESARVRTELSLQQNMKVMSFILMCRDKAKMKFQQITDKLIADQYLTITGKKYVVGTVIQLYHKAKKLELNNQNKIEIL